MRKMLMEAHDKEHERIYYDQETGIHIAYIFNFEHQFDDDELGKKYFWTVEIENAYELFSLEGQQGKFPRTNKHNSYAECILELEEILIQYGFSYLGEFHDE